MTPDVTQAQTIICRQTRTPHNRGPGFYYYHAHCHGLRFGIAKTSLILVGTVAKKGHTTFRVLDASEIFSPEECYSGCEGKLSGPPG